mgnify:FL=1
MVRLNDDEEGALFALPPTARICYILGLRPFMDFKTGIVGDKRRVSYQSLMELLEFEPDRGSHLGAICRATPDSVRSELARLERAGLVERLPKRKRTDPLRLKMVLADVDGKNPSQEDPRTTPKQGAPNICSGTNSPVSRASSTASLNLGNKNGRMSDKGVPSNERHTSVLPFTTTTTKNISIAREAENRLAGDWLPSIEVMTKLAGDEFVEPAFVDEYIAEFVMYWSRSGVEKGSWDAVFFRQCLEQWKRRRFSWCKR